MPLSDDKIAEIVERAVTNAVADIRSGTAPAPAPGGSPAPRKGRDESAAPSPAARRVDEATTREEAAVALAAMTEPEREAWRRSRWQPGGPLAEMANHAFGRAIIE